MNIRTVRRISQIFFAALFVWLCVVATVGEKWWQLRGWPINWLLQLDPLVALATVVTTGALFAGLLWALLTIVLTVILGRFFCGWVCPFGSLHQLVGYLARRVNPFKQRIAANQYRKSQAIKYYILIFMLTAAAGGLLSALARGAKDKPLLGGIVLFAGVLALTALAVGKVVPQPKRAALTVLGLVALWAGLGTFFEVGQTVAVSLQTGLLDPIPLIHRSVNLVLAPIADSATHVLSPTQRFYEGAWLIAAIFFGAVLLNLVIPRFYCRILCPLGALLGVLGRWAVWRIGKADLTCTDCELCEDNCEGACEPFEKIRISECLMCMNCLDSCNQIHMAYQTKPSESGELTSPEITRRGFILWAAAGVATVPMLRVGGLLGTNWKPDVIRPPGSLAEEEFLSRCIKCGQCMRACPTNIIQPAALQAGLEGVWSPVLNFRVGTSGCQLNCIACGHVCPTAAIRPFSLDEKLGRGEFKEEGPIRMGTAFVDRGRCLPFAMDKPCIVCQENCPVSPKAIFLREQFNEVRGSALTVQSVNGRTLELRGALMTPSEFASGDYYCAVNNSEGGSKWRISDNTEDTITISEDTPWEEPPIVGSKVAVLVRLQLPYVDVKFCTGCGICEHECPVSGLRAIRVTAENETRSISHSLILPTAGGKIK